MFFSWDRIISYEQFKNDFKYIKIDQAYKHNIIFYYDNNAIELQYIELVFFFKNSLYYSKLASFPQNNCINNDKYHYFVHLVNNKYLYANLIDNCIYYGIINNNIFHDKVSFDITDKLNYNLNISNFKENFNKILLIIKAAQLLKELNNK